MEQVTKWLTLYTGEKLLEKGRQHVSYFDCR